MGFINQLGRGLYAAGGGDLAAMDQNTVNYQKLKQDAEQWKDGEAKRQAEIAYYNAHSNYMTAQGTKDYTDAGWTPMANMQQQGMAQLPPQAAMSMVNGTVGNAAGKSLGIQDPVQSIMNDAKMTKMQTPYGMMVRPTDYQDETKLDKVQVHQDMLEQKAKDGFTQIRGDKSIGRIEEQRDAAITAYNTIETIKKENRLPSKLEYYDLLGQMWKARTGTAPTNEALKDLDQSTFKGDIGKAYTYITGKTTGATTQEVLNNIQQFAAQSGVQADQLHSGYMASRMEKPTGLSQARWDKISKMQRGLSFADATGHKEQSPEETFIAKAVASGYTPAQAKAYLAKQKGK